ncbi:uncharacterized protein B0P05DRAFT_469094 [Gilbertella persicaria]|uniref:uncharacterized protein n=1 Tax=Gilbertella persicaria TaxID=101096 RepID=UPI002220F7E6|nr:uncharacterized protein B0P05DRAFT_469094 [Gilbertella persicaria]KAI8080756.1 hypothetical protein B0P05DRAFT_469094 [Gilbertella persicaria]
MSSSTHNSRHSTTIINIHSPEDEQLPIEENDTSRRASSASRQPPKPSPKVDEYRKMIRHIVSKIVKRKRPPTALFRLSELCRTTEVSDLFENDDTIDLLIQLRSALMVCHQVGLSTQVLLQGPSKSPENLYSGISHSKNDKRSEFDTILYVLSDLILNDSRYKTANPKPSRPPYTMQAILIDLAILLVQIRDDSSGLYHIGTVFMPAFESFSEGTMLRRLLSFYLDNLLPKLIKCKDEPKSKSNESRKSLKAESSSNKKSNNPNTPTINIHSPEPDRSDTPVKTSHLTIDTRPLTVEAASHSSPVSPAAYSTNNNTLDAYHAYALFTPLLFFMIQYLDPYLAAQPTKAQQENFTYTLTRQASLIHNFHKALTYMMSCKPDLYLDLLDIISRSTPEVKFRACQILFNYYFVSVGHIVVADPLPVLGTKEELEVLDQHRLQQELEEEHQKNHQHGNRTQQHRPIRKTTHIVSENSVEDHHIWYPHMFAEHDKVSKILANNPFSFGIHRDTTESYCKECFKSIQGCGLRCFQCKSNVHYNCFNSKSHFDGQNMLFYLKAGGIQKVLTPQYCVVPPQPRFRDMVDCGILGWNAKSSSAQVGLLGHMFRLVNIYTIVVCACCGLPLWGVSLQGYQCSQCNRFVHPQCLVDAEEKNSFLKIKSSKASTPHSFQTCVPQSPLLETDIKISQADLNKSLSDFYGDALPLNKESLEGRSFEEASLMLDVFLMQEAILHCGVASGCIIITNESDHPLLFTPSPSVEASNLPENFSNHSSSLSQAINVYTSYLDSEDYQSSAFFKDFFGHSDASTIKHLLSKEEFLCHLAAMMKSLTTSFGSTMTGTPTADKRRSAGDSRGFLQVSPNPFTSAGWEEDEESEFDEGHTPNENLDRSMLLSWVMTNLNFRNRKAAEILLQHMHNLGLFERFDASPFLFLSSTIEQEPAVQCVFPVPFAIDFSANVEILINSIEACMRDIDLSINECGLLLLVRRCWPDPFMSGYSRERLIHAIIAWTFDEDERLLALHAEITSVNRHSSLHHAKQQKKWAQAALLARMKGQNISERNRQSTFQLNTAAGVSSGASNMYVTTRTGLKDRYVLRWMSAVHKMDPEAYTDILFNAVEEIIDSKKEKCAIPNWEESSDVKVCDAITLCDKEPVELRNLVKLCSSKTLNAKQPGTLSTNSVHPIDLIVSQFQGKQGSDRGIRWLTLAAHSGYYTCSFLSHLSKVLVSVQLPLDIMVSFVEIVWYQVVHIPLFATQRAAIAEIVGYLNQSNADILASMNDNSSLPDESLIHVQDFVKYSAALACFAYGCSPNEVIEAGIVPYVGDHASKAS